MITGGFGTTIDLATGLSRRWVMGRDGVKRWADTGEPVNPASAPSQAEEHHVRTAARLYEMRDKARRLLGDKFKPHMAELGKILTVTAQRDGKTPLAVATEIAKKRELVGIELMLVMAAAVELAEPTP